MIAHAYIDGFNLYYGIKGRPSAKWLDVEALVDRIFPNDEIRLVRYFTAAVKGRIDPGAPVRQDAYLRAIDARDRVTIHRSKFLAKTRWMPLEHRKHPKVPVVRTEEKGSDVNLASYLLLDAVEDRYEMAIVVSNDSDLKEPIRLVQQPPFSKTVWVVNPLRWPRANMNATHHLDMKWRDVKRSQLPDVVGLPNGKVVRRPEQWVRSGGTAGELTVQSQKPREAHPEG